MSAAQPRLPGIHRRRRRRAQRRLSPGCTVLNRPCPRCGNVARLWGQQGWHRGDRDPLLQGAVCPPCPAFNPNSPGLGLDRCHVGHGQAMWVQLVWHIQGMRGPQCAGTPLLAGCRPPSVQNSNAIRTPGSAGPQYIKDPQYIQDPQPHRDPGARRIGDLQNLQAPSSFQDLQDPQCQESPCAVPSPDPASPHLPLRPCPMPNASPSLVHCTIPE